MEADLNAFGADYEQYLMVKRKRELSLSVVSI